MAAMVKKGFSEKCAAKGYLCPAHAGGPINPEWIEHLMGFPIGWTEIEDWQTQSCRKSQNGSGHE
jgi:hypothetical protein